MNTTLTRKSVRVVFTPGPTYSNCVDHDQHSYQYAKPPLVILTKKNNFSFFNIGFQPFCTLQLRSKKRQQ